MARTAEPSPGGGDAADFDAFYRESRDRLFGQVYAYTGDRGDAQDCLAEAYLRAWQRWAQVSRYEAPEAWVRTVAFRLAVNRWRKATGAVKAWRRHGTVATLPEPNEDHVDLVRALRRLPEAQRQALVLYHMADLSVDQIAAELQCPTGTVKARLARGRAALAVLLVEDSPPGEPEPQERKLP